MTDHPSDEFDGVPETSTRQGMHRRRFIPGRSGGLALKLTVGILALLILAVAFLLLPRFGLTMSGAHGASLLPRAFVVGTPDVSPVLPTPGPEYR